MLDLVSLAHGMAQAEDLAWPFRSELLVPNGCMESSAWCYVQKSKQDALGGFKQKEDLEIISSLY